MGNYREWVEFAVVFWLVGAWMVLLVRALWDAVGAIAGLGRDKEPDWTDEVIDVKTGERVFEVRPKARRRANG